MFRPSGSRKIWCACAVGEPDDLVFDRGAVARAGALDLARIHRRAVEVGSDQVVDGGIGVGDVAVELRLRSTRIGEEREGDRLGIARLRLQAVEVDRASVEPRRRAGLEPQELEAQRAQACR